MSVWVVDTGDRDVYVVADDECAAGEQVVALTGAPILYVEHYSDDEGDMP